MRRPIFALLIVSLALLACNLTSSPSTPTPLPRPTQPTIIFVTATPPRFTPFPTVGPAPVTNIPCVPQTSWPLYTVQSGDTVANIASRTGTTIDVLVSANCLTNPSLITVGQALRVPRLPTQPTATTNFGGSPAVGQIVIQPATAGTGGGFVVPLGTVTVYATGVANATVVTFYILPAGTFNPIIIGRDDRLQDGAAVPWVVSDASLNVQIYAVATNSINQNAQTIPVQVTAQQQVPAPIIGTLSITPSSVDPVTPNTLILPLAPVTISVSGVQNAAKVEFYFVSTAIAGSQPIKLGEALNPVNNAGIVWNTSTMGVTGTGLVWAVARNSAGQSATTASTPVNIR